MKIKVISVILAFLLCAALLASCTAAPSTNAAGKAETGGESEGSGGETSSNSGEEETLPPPIEVADGSFLSFQRSEDGTYYSVWGLLSESGAIKVVIPSEYQGLPVAAISDYAFSSSDPLTTVIIPDSVTHIGAHAFDGCSNLTNLDLPANLEFIGEGAFDGCDSLPLNTYDNGLYIGDSEAPYSIFVSATDTEIESCTIHPDTKIIYDGSFFDCTEIDEIIFPDEICQIGFAFQDCHDLFPNNSVDGAFYLGNAENPFLILVYALNTVTDITVHEDTEMIAPYAFEGCSSLSSVTLSANIRFIGNNAFLGCSSLTDVSMADSSWSIINGDNIASCVTVNSADGNLADLLSKTYYYGTWVKQ